MSFNLNLNRAKIMPTGSSPNRLNWGSYEHQQEILATDEEIDHIKYPLDGEYNFELQAVTTPPDPQDPWIDDYDYSQWDVVATGSNNDSHKEVFWQALKDVSAGIHPPYYYIDDEIAIPGSPGWEDYWVASDLSWTLVDTAGQTINSLKGWGGYLYVGAISLYKLVDGSLVEKVGSGSYKWQMITTLGSLFVLDGYDLYEYDGVNYTQRTSAPNINTIMEFNAGVYGSVSPNAVYKWDEVNTWESKVSSSGEYGYFYAVEGSYIYYCSTTDADIYHTNGNSAWSLTASFPLNPSNYDDFNLIDFKVFDTDLYVSCTTTVDSVITYRVYRYDGSWHSVGSVTYDGDYRSAAIFVEHDSDVYTVGGGLCTYKIVSDSLVLVADYDETVGGTIPYRNAVFSLGDYIYASCGRTTTLYKLNPL